MRIKICSVIFLSGMVLLNPFKGFASSPFDSSSLLKVYEDSIKAIQYVRINARTDQEKDESNKQLVRLMTKALKLPGSFAYPFDSLVTIGKEVSPDNKFRLITWDVPKSGCTFAYYGFIQSYNPKKKGYDLFVLEDHSADFPNQQTATYTPNKWIGMLYYKIIKEKDTKFYTLLAWQGVNKQITRKIIEIISFNPQGIPVFGKAVFTKLPSTFKGNPKRLIFEYSAQVSMTLRYDDAKKVIMFDMLGPIEDGLEGQHQYYGPSFQIDGLASKDGIWNYLVNVDARNPNGKVDKLFNDPENPTYQLQKKAIYTPH